MKKNGFTLVELLVVVALLALASGFVATRFFNLTGRQDEFEDEVLAKGLAEAAYVYYKHVENENCITTDELLQKGYISEDQGLLTQYGDKLYNYAVEVKIVDGERITKVYKSKNNTKCTGNNCCSSTGGTEINY